MAGESAFLKWFIEQHGTRVTEKYRKVEDDELLDIAFKGDSARAEWQRRREWDLRRESALYAWQVEERA